MAPKLTINALNSGLNPDTGGKIKNRYVISYDFFYHGWHGTCNEMLICCLSQVVIFLHQLQHRKIVVDIVKLYILFSNVICLKS